MVAINALKPGDVVYDVSREKMGNTTLRRQVVRNVNIKSVSEDKRSVEASWNGNSVRTFREREVARWKRNKPAAKPNAFNTALGIARARES